MPASEDESKGHAQELLFPALNALLAFKYCGLAGKIAGPSTKSM
jgi:hypothetical protein